MLLYFSEYITRCEGESEAEGGAESHTTRSYAGTLIGRRIGLADAGDIRFSFSSRVLGEVDLSESRLEIEAFFRWEGSMDVDTRRLAAVAVGVTDVALVTDGLLVGVAEAVEEKREERLVGGGPIDPSIARFAVAEGATDVLSRVLRARVPLAAVGGGSLNFL